MYSDPVVRLKRLPAHRTGGFSPRNTGNLVGYLSHLPALCPFRQILSPKESRHLLLHSPQCPFLDDDFIFSKLHWCWNWSRLGLRSCRPDQSLSWLLLVPPPVPQPRPRWRDLHSSHPRCQMDARSSSGTPSSRRPPTQTSADLGQL